MILELQVENIGIIESSTLILEPGMTVMTGETGAGKSLLVDAITLALGGRADSDLVRAGAAKGTVSLLADVSRSPTVLTKCAELGVEVEDGQLAIQRDLSAEGRSTVRLNGRPVSVGVLKTLGDLLVDLHGQHDHQALLNQEKQVEFLDSWIGHEALEALAAVEDAFSKAESTRRQLAQLRTSQREREQRVDMLRFQIQDIEQVGLKPGEVAELDSLIERLRHSEKLRELTLRASALLSDEESSVETNLGTAVRDLESAAQYDSTLNSVLGQAREALVALREVSSEVRTYHESLDLEPQALESSASRLDKIKMLLRKYGDSETAVLEYLESAQQELAQLEDSSVSEEALQQKLEEEQLLLNRVASKLTALRSTGAKQFANLVQECLRDLAMERAEFGVMVQPKSIDATGADNVDFEFSANAGEPPRSLSKVASGGEISRVMLAIKSASAGRAGVPTLVFDEVDTGLSGKAAATTAKKLGQLATHCQIVAISHLPQIAAQADHHFRIEKSIENGRTVTRVVRLQGEDRVAEVARMLAGESVGESAMANAREMVAHSRSL